MRSCEIADAAMGGIRRGGRWLRVRYALWLEFALASQKILASARAAADHGMETADFGQRRFRFEVCLLLGIGLALFRGVQLPPRASCWLLRIAAYGARLRDAPPNSGAGGRLVLAVPLAKQIGGTEFPIQVPLRRCAACCSRASPIVLVAGTFAYASVHRFEPQHEGLAGRSGDRTEEIESDHGYSTDYDFSAAILIANGVAPFIDGRTELYGEKSLVDHKRRQRVDWNGKSFRLLANIRIEATPLMRPRVPPQNCLDHIDAGQKVYADDIATNPISVSPVRCIR